MSDPYEVPENPEVSLKTEEQEPVESAAQLITYLEERQLIPEAVTA